MEFTCPEQLLEKNQRQTAENIGLFKGECYLSLLSRIFNYRQYLTRICTSYFTAAATGDLVAIQDFASKGVLSKDMTTYF
jgi:hypothetical protein